MMIDTKNTVTYPLSAITGEDEMSDTEVLREFYDKAYAAGVVAVAAAVNAAVAAERERCAKVCEKRANGNSGKVDWWLMSAAAAIRKGE